MQKLHYGAQNLYYESLKLCYGYRKLHYGAWKLHCGAMQATKDCFIIETRNPKQEKLYFWWLWLILLDPPFLISAQICLTLSFIF